MAADIWTLNLECDGAAPRQKHVQREMDRDEICFYNLIDLIEEYGYTSVDYLFYKRRDSLVAIEQDSEVMEMLNEYKSEKMVNCTASDHGNSQKQGMHFNRKRVQCVAPNQKEVLLKQTNELCQGHADDKEISIEEAEASSPHGSAIDSRQIEFDSCPRISGEGRITKKQKDHQDVARDKATCQKRPKHMQDHPMKVGSTVLLMTVKYPNKEIMAYATIISTNPKANVGGVETGKQFYKVRINHPVEKDEPLVRPMPTYNNIGDAHAKGVPIAWPSIFVQMING